MFLSSVCKVVSLVSKSASFSARVPMSCHGITARCRCSSICVNISVTFAGVSAAAAVNLHSGVCGGGEALCVVCAGAKGLLGPCVRDRERGGIPPLGSAIPKCSDGGLCLRALALLAGAVRLPAPVATARKGLDAGAGTTTLGGG